MRYIEINDKLYLVEQEVTKKGGKEVKIPKGLNHIFIYDRSGSMYGVLDTLIVDLKARLRTVPNGDTVTIGYFSSPGEFRFPLKGLKVSGKADFASIDKILDANSTTLGSTCFSEILDDTKQVVKDLKPLGNGFALCFLTDGYPTVYPYETEVKAIKTAITNVAGEIASSLLVGYGNYYNKELLSDMASQLSGALIHSSKLSDFPTAYQKFMDKSRDSEPKMLVELLVKPASEGGAVFSLSGGTVNLYSVENGAVAFSPTKNSNENIYILSDKKPKNGVQVLCRQGVLTSDVDQSNESFVKAMYAAAYVLTQRTKTDVALEALSILGDKAAIDRVNNAFTNAEYGAAEQGILEAIGSPQKRYASGCVANYLPKPDAFCLLDALDLLTNDEEAEFYPYHDDFEYNKIGVGTKTKGEFPKFEAKKDARVPMTGLVWNDTKLNLSIRAKIDGTIDLGKGAKKVGLESTFDTFVWRNYTLVKDGFLNVQRLPVTLSKASYDRFLAEGVIDAEHNRHYKGRCYTLNLDRVPVINRQIANGKTSAKTLCENTFNEMKFMANLKALNFVRGEIEPLSERGLGLNLTDTQEEFLKEKGVTKSGFNPPTEKLEATDFYMAKEFEVKIKGLSSLPKVDEVKTKVASKKALTVSGQLVADGLHESERVLKLAGSKKEDRLNELDFFIRSQKTQLGKVRGEIQRTKFSIILAKKWFDEFTSREDNKLTIDGNEFTIGVREVKVDI